MRTVFGMVVVAMVVASAAEAQTVTSGAPRVEVGFTGGGLVGPQVGFVGGFGPHVTVNVARRTAIEVHLDEYPVLGNKAAARSLDGFYQVQVKQIVKGAGTATQVFVTGGVFGEFQFRHYNETPFGSTVLPAHDFNDVSRPFGIIGGVGVTHIANAHLGLRFDAQAGYAKEVFILRFFAGVTIPLGSYRR